LVSEFSSISGKVIDRTAAAVSGKLDITVFEAKFTRDTEFGFNKMDPFISLLYREQAFKTKVL
jgi:hypothetical protein